MVLKASLFDESSKDPKESTPITLPEGPKAKPLMPMKLEFENRKYYSEIVEIDIGEGYKMMRESFRPSWKDESGVLSVVKCDLPLGMVIEGIPENTENRLKGTFGVVEVTEGSNAHKAGIKVSDCLRACNATVAKKVVDATAFIEADTRRTRALFTVDGQTFDRVIDAIQSNTEEGSVTMVFERNMKTSS